MSRSTISTFKLFELFPDEPSARKYLEGRLWKDGVTCSECKSVERITTRKDGFYRCNACKLDFTVRTGTIFERSHVPLHKWLYAMYLLVTAPDWYFDTSDGTLHDGRPLRRPKIEIKLYSCTKGKPGPNGMGDSRLCFSHEYVGTKKYANAWEI